MEVFVPSIAVQAGAVVGGFVYVVVNTSGEVSGLFISKVALGVAAASGAAVGLLAGPIAGTLTSAAVKDLVDGMFVPAVKTGSRLTGLGLAAGAGLATVAVVSLLYVGGHYVLQAVRAVQKGDVTPIDYTLFADDDFNVITLEPAVGNPEGPSSLSAGLNVKALETL
jgi:hypothetical protein